MGFSSLWNSYDTTLDKVIWAFFVGIVIAAFAIWYNQSFIGGAVRRLIKKNADSPENALTLGELGLNNPLIRRALASSDSTLRKTVYAASDKKKLVKSDFSSVGFYVPKELKYRAEVRYKGKNTNVVVLIITIVAVFILAMLCQRYLPKLLDLI